MNWSWVKVAFLCSFMTAVIFSMFSLVFYFGEWKRLFLVASLGLFVGLVVAPEIEPKVFKMAWLFQMSSGLVAGGLIAWILELSPESFFSSIIVGGLLGWTAPFWVKYIPIP